MTISSELQAKIDALEDEKLKARILRALTSTGKKQATDEEIYELILSSYTEAKEQRARLIKWKNDDVSAFALYFEKEKTADYAEFMRQETQFNEIEARLAWDVRRLILEWRPDIGESDVTGLFSMFRDYVKANSG